MGWVFCSLKYSNRKSTLGDFFSYSFHRSCSSLPTQLGAPSKPVNYFILESILRLVKLASIQRIFCCCSLFFVVVPQNCSNSMVACSKKMLPKSRQSLSCFEEHGARYFLGFVPLHRLVLMGCRLMAELARSSWVLNYMYSIDFQFLGV